MRLILSVDSKDIARAKGEYDKYFKRIPSFIDAAIQDIGGRMVNVVVSIFTYSATGGGLPGYPDYEVDWLENARITLQRRVARGFYGTKPLIASGALLASFMRGLKVTKRGSSRTATVSSAGTGDLPPKRVATLFLGYPRGVEAAKQKIPGRPMLPVGAEGYRLASTLVGRAIIPLFEAEFERREAQDAGDAD